MTSARAVITLCIAFALPIAAQQAPVRQPPAQTPRDSRPLLRSGPVLGYATITEVAVWLQTTQPVTAQLRYWPKGRPAESALSSLVTTTPLGDHIARFTLTGLTFGTRYEYEVYLDGVRVAIPYRTEFQTQAMWHWRTDPPPFRFAIGSCAYVNDPPFDRPGTPYGGGMEIFRSIAAENPDLMLWIGDNVYLREEDWESEQGIRYRYAHTRSLPEMQPLFGATHNYATWDDHDYGPDNADRTFRMKDASLRTFRDYWPNQTFGLADHPGVFFRFTWNDVEFFMLDDRYHRSPNNWEPASERVMFGERQMQWLLEALRSSTATFKVVVSGNQVLKQVRGRESLTDFPTEHAKLLDFLQKQKISGVLFVSGDRHHTVLTRQDLPGFYPLYDFTVSSLTAGLSPPKGAERQDPMHVPGTLVDDRKNFATVDVSGPRNERVLTLRVLGPDGKEAWKHVLKASELQVAAAGTGEGH